MPDPLRYLQATCAAALITAFVVLAARRLGIWRGGDREAFTGIVATTAGSVAGLLILPISLHWPPSNGLDRLLLIWLPVAVAVELVAGARPTANWIAAWRTSLVVAGSPVLLYGSVYFSSQAGVWSPVERLVTLFLIASMLAVVLLAFAWLPRRSADPTPRLTIALALATSGVAIMFAGYLNGGSIAFPLSAAIAAAALVAPGEQATRWNGVNSLSVVALFGELFIGRYFGGLSTVEAVMVLLAPTLCWVGELPWLRQREPWQRTAVVLLVVTIPLGAVLWPAKRAFDRELKPLMQRTGRVRSAAVGQITPCGRRGDPS